MTVHVSVRSISALLLLSVSFLGLPAGTPAQSVVAPPKTAPTLAERLDRLAAEIDRNRIDLHVPGAALAIVRGDEVIFARGFGVADVGKKTPVTPNTPFFIGRQVFYFAVWNAIAYLLTSWSAEHDRTGDPALLNKMSTLSGAGVLIYGLTVTFAMVDWTMSVNPHWFSTIWGMLYIGGQGLSAFAFGICVLVMLAQTTPLNKVLTSHHFHDLGKLLFAFLMLWAYLSFSQFIIIWSANLPDEIPHYLDRWENTWKFLSIFIVVGHFMVPYALLLSRDLKRNYNRLRIIAIWLLLARLAEYFWHVAPELHKDGLTISLLDVALPLVIGGIFISLFVSNLGGRSLLPVNDPDLDKALHHHVH
jgi:hypothetical protein